MKETMTNNIENMRKGIFYINDNREVTIKYFEQAGTYRYLLEGLPCDTLNDRIIKGLKERMNEKYAEHYHVYFIEPTRTPLKGYENYPLGKGERLPGVTCIAEIHSIAPTIVGYGDSSELIVVWFQNSYALPIDQEIVEHLENISWEKLARDYYY